jgi:hypothetical protein
MRDQILQPEDTAVAGERLVKHASAETNMHATIEELYEECYRFMDEISMRNTGIQVQIIIRSMKILRLYRF